MLCRCRRRRRCCCCHRSHHHNQPHAIEIKWKTIHKYTRRKRNQIFIEKWQLLYYIRFPVRPTVQPSVRVWAVRACVFVRVGIINVVDYFGKLLLLILFYFILRRHETLSLFLPFYSLSFLLVLLFYFYFYFYSFFSACWIKLLSIVLVKTPGAYQLPL